jgi:hypothetical protein
MNDKYPTATNFAVAKFDPVKKHYTAIVDLGDPVYIFKKYIFI